FGTRLRPLTRATPKQMLPVGNRPMIERVVEHLAAHGVTSVVLALGYRADVFQAAYPDGDCMGVALHYAIEPEPRDTAGAIRFAALDAGITERFLVLNADVLTDLDIGALLATHERTGAEGTLALHRVDDPSAFGVVPTDSAGRVTAFIEKPPRDEAPTDLINAGIYVLEPSVIDRIEPDVPVNVERVTFPAMVDDGCLYAMDGDTYWIDAGTPATYLTANLDLLNGRRSTVEEGVHPDAVVDGAVVGSVVGPGARIGDGAIVSGSVVFAGADIGAGALVRDAIIGARSRVGAGAVLEEGTVVGDDVVVPNGAHLIGVRIPEES
ncbi:MAG: NDP-sugar synthase, partial [Acidimicrobiales bacterium]